MTNVHREKSEFEAGANYVREQVTRHGIQNKFEMDRLWIECDNAFDRSDFDRGMLRTLIEMHVPDPQD